MSKRKSQNQNQNIASKKVKVENFDACHQVLLGLPEILLKITENMRARTMITMLRVCKTFKVLIYFLLRLTI